MTNKLTIIECPRDAMQGLGNFIPTERKVEYINSLLQVGFDTVDFGSFVSAKAVPQMKDTAEVYKDLELSTTTSQLLAIIANLRGAEQALAFKNIQYLGYPLSISETFQQKNTNKSIVQSLEELLLIQELCIKHNKTLVVYLSMAFGNPYGDHYDHDILNQFAGILISLGVTIISISDTVGLATAKEVTEVFKVVSVQNSDVEWGLHLHAIPDVALDKVQAALEAGCRRIDGAILGFGGCPMADNDLVGNINTKIIIDVANRMGIAHGLNEAAFQNAEHIAQKIFFSA